MREGQVALAGPTEQKGHILGSKTAGDAWLLGWLVTMSLQSQHFLLILGTFLVLVTRVVVNAPATAVAPTPVPWCKPRIIGNWDRR